MSKQPVLRLGPASDPARVAARFDSTRLMTHSTSRFLRIALVGLFAWLLATSLNGARWTDGSIGRASVAAQETQASHHSSQAEGGHSDPFATIMLELALVILAAAGGRWGALRMAQPAVLGELLIGILLGNVGYWLERPLFQLTMHLGEAGPLLDEILMSGVAPADAARRVFSEAELQAGGIGAQMLGLISGPSAPNILLMGFALWLFSNLGVILLLFMVGLESSVEEMLRVGPRASLVAVIGIVAPFLLGLATTTWLLPESSGPVHIFLAATLCATSVGITARVLKDLERIHTIEAKTILGAAVIDDVLGLVILAVVVGIAATGEIRLAEVVRITLASLVFLGAVIFLGERVVRWAARHFSRIDPHHGKLLFPLALMSIMGWIANQIQLATIVGAFAAGLILSERHFADHYDKSITMEKLIGPLEAIFAPVFFVLMGMQVNVASFVDPSTLSLAFALTVVAILGKLVSGWPAGPGLNRMMVGLGMVPRGEVGLIFAGVGKSLGVVTDSLFSALVVMVIVTTLITPITLKWAVSRARPPRGAEA